MKCNSCNHTNVEGAARCAMCGADLTGTETDGEGFIATMAMPVPKELLEAAAQAAAEVHADLTEEAAVDESSEASMGATMGMQAVPEELLNLAIDPETGELTEVGEDPAPPSEEEASDGVPDRDTTTGIERTVFEQAAITDFPDPEPKAEPETEPEADDGPPAEAPAAATPTVTTEAPMSRSQLRTIVLAAVGLGVLAMLVPLVMTLSSGGSHDGAGRVAIQNFPSHANFVGSLSLDRLRQTWVYEELGEKGLTSFGERATLWVSPRAAKAAVGLRDGLDLELGKIDEIAFGAQVGSTSVRGTKSPRPIIAVRGRFDPKAMEAALESTLGALEEGAPESVSKAGFYGKDGQVAGLVDDNTLLGGSVHMLAAAVAARQGTASIASHAGLMAALDDVDSAAVLWGGLQVTEDLLDSVRDRLSAETASLLATGDALAFSLSVEEAVQLRLALYVVDESRAEGLTSSLQGLLAKAQLAGLAAAAAPFKDETAGLKALLDSAKVTRDGPVIRMTAAVPRATVETALKLTKE